MCNRFASKARLTEYLKLVQEAALTDDMSDILGSVFQTEIKPTDKAPVIFQSNGAVTIKMMRFGLIPHFHRGSIKDWKPMTTNARTETLKTTASYMKAFESQRCIIPFSHFIEWSGPKKRREKLKITPTTNMDLSFAGIWDRAETTDGIIEGFSIITRPANEQMQPYHDRQPVILYPDQYGAWLNNKFTPSKHNVAEFDIQKF